MHIFRQPAETEVHRLLNAADLPTTDLKTQNFEHFFGLGSEQGLKGVIGLEIYGPNALLRSLAVETGNRGTAMVRRWWQKLNGMLKGEA